ESTSTNTPSTADASPHPVSLHPRKSKANAKSVKLLILPKECIFNKDETPDTIQKSIRIPFDSQTNESSSCESSMINQTSFSTEHDIPTSWSADLREGLAMMEIDYKQFSDEQLPSIYSLFNVLSQAANVYMCNSEIIPLVLPRERLEQELKERRVFFQESDSREMLVHTLEMDILFRSQR
ncbi:hypothetical protein WA577_005142, partial [Blastocystis sp. JDR]